MLGFSTSPRFVEHDAGRRHPECPGRIRAIFAAVRESGLVVSPNPLDDFKLEMGALPRGKPVLEIEPVAADESWISKVHTARHIERVKHFSELSGVLDQGDTIVCRASYDIAKLAVGALLACADAVVDGRARRAFAAVRPPGHHAEPNRVMGFCLFSNLAIAARYLQLRHGVGRIAIVDFDVHHGNGTQACFEEDPSVLFISLHQDPRTCYPGSGFASEIGTGPGSGFTLNIPLPPGTEDEAYLEAVQAKVLPKIDSFHPEFLLISAGFDAHRDDPLASLNLSEDGFAKITSLLVESAERHCGGKILSTLEGGYNLRELGRCVAKHMIALQD